MSYFIISFNQFLKAWDSCPQPGFARVPLRWRRIFIGGAILSIISYIIRALRYLWVPYTYNAILLFIFIVNNQSETFLYRSCSFRQFLL